MGYEEGGQLTEAVRRKPYSVVLFDEIEKAHPDVFNVLLQVLDDGRITDSQGRTVDFKNTILIMTSNIGASYLLEGIDREGNISGEAEKMVMEELRDHFRPEFLNRLDETILFKPLSKENISGIIKLIIADLNRRLEDRELSISLTPQAEAYIVNLVGQHPGITVTQLAEILNKTTSACSQIVRKLRAKGFVEQIRNPDNNRLYNLALTESGRKVYEARHAFNLECQAITFRLLEGFSEEELEAHLRVQQVLNQAYEGDIRRSREAMKKE